MVASACESALGGAGASVTRTASSRQQYNGMWFSFPVLPRSQYNLAWIILKFLWNQWRYLVEIKTKFVTIKFTIFYDLHTVKKGSII